MAAARNNGRLPWLLVGIWGAVCSSSVQSQQPQSDFERFSRRAVVRDAFPVFHNPKLVKAGQAKNVADNDWVIGVALNKEAKAYPIRVMGIHELGNDTIGGEPIAVSW
jgi:hypothetical protein